MQLAWAGMGNAVDGGMGPLLPPDNEGDEDGDYEELDDEADEMEDVDAIAAQPVENDVLPIYVGPNAFSDFVSDRTKPWIFGEHSKDLIKIGVWNPGAFVLHFDNQVLPDIGE